MLSHGCWWTGWPRTDSTYCLRRARWPAKKSSICTSTSFRATTTSPVWAGSSTAVLCPMLNWIRCIARFRWAREPADPFGTGNITIGQPAAGSRGSGVSATVCGRVVDLALHHPVWKAHSLAAVDDRPAGLCVRGQGHARGQGHLRHYDAVLESLLHLSADCGDLDDPTGLRPVSVLASGLDRWSGLGPAVGAETLRRAARLEAGTARHCRAGSDGADSHHAGVRPGEYRPYGVGHCRSIAGCAR